MWNKIKKLGSSILLFIVAAILSIICLPLGILFVIYRTIFHYRKSTPIGFITYVFFAFAAVFDFIGCVICGPLFNLWFIKKESNIYFGNIFHTISLIMAFNYRKGWLTKDAMLLYNIIEKIDPGHFETTIQNYEDTTLKTFKYFY